MGECGALGPWCLSSNPSPGSCLSCGPGQISELLCASVSPNKHPGVYLLPPRCLTESLTSSLHTFAQTIPPTRPSPFPLSVPPNSPYILRPRSNVASSRKPAQATFKSLMAYHKIYLLSITKVLVILHITFILVPLCRFFLLNPFCR